MASVRVCLHNLPPSCADRLAAVMADHDLQPVARPPADVAVIGIDTVADLSGMLARFATEAGLLHTPIIAVAGPDSPEAWHAAMGVVQAYVPGCDPHRIAAAVRMVYNTLHAFAALHPLTGLPGSPALQREIEARLAQRGSLAVIQFDLDNFKPYNDVYGYHQGDQMILWLKGLIEQAVADCRPAHWFLAHLGGDDFILTADVCSARIIAAKVLQQFEDDKSRFFSPEHDAAGRFVAVDRTGHSHDIPLTSLTAVMVTNAADDITHPGHVAAVLAEMKAYAKPIEGSNFVADRRRNH